MSDKKKLFQCFFSIFLRDFIRVVAIFVFRLYFLFFICFCVSYLWKSMKIKYCPFCVIWAKMVAGFASGKNRHAIYNQHCNLTRNPPTMDILTKILSVLPLNTSFYPVLSGFIRFQPVLSGFITFYWTWWLDLTEIFGQI